MIHIVVRKTVDWNDTVTEAAQIPDELRATVALWDATFALPFHVFRRELKCIAQRNLAAVTHAGCTPAEDVPADAWAVPIDDDDWLAPDLTSAIKPHGTPSLQGLSWQSRFLEVPISFPHQLGLWRRRLLPRTRPRWLCTTNNYAVVMGAETADLLAGHIRATRWFLAHPYAVARLDRPLSLMNRSLASTTQLRSRLSRALLLSKHARYTRLYERPLPSDLAWAEPYRAMMCELHAQLLPAH